MVARLLHLMIVRVPVTRSRFMVGIILGPENPMEHCKVLEDNLSYDVGSVILYRLRVLGQWGMALRNNRGWCLKQLMHLPIRSLHHRNVVEQMAMLSSFAILDLNYPLVCFARDTQLCVVDRVPMLRQQAAPISYISSFRNYRQCVILSHPHSVSMYLNAHVIAFLPPLALEAACLLLHVM